MLHGYSGARRGMPQAGLRIWKAAADCILPAAAVDAAGAENTSTSWPMSRSLLRPKWPAPYGQRPRAASKRQTLLAPPTARWGRGAVSAPRIAEANHEQQRAQGSPGLSFLRKAEAEVTRGTGGGNHGAAGEGRSCRCRRCREPRR